MDSDPYDVLLMPLPSRPETIQERDWEEHGEDAGGPEHLPRIQALVGSDPPDSPAPGLQGTGMEAEPSLASSEPSGDSLCFSKPMGTCSYLIPEPVLRFHLD